MQKGWYKKSMLRLIVLGAKEFATQEGFTGEAHREEVKRLVSIHFMDI